MKIFSRFLAASPFMFRSKYLLVFNNCVTIDWWHQSQLGLILVLNESSFGLLSGLTW
jgi:hypothetical protein